jgi:hypothetical protein
MSVIQLIQCELSKSIEENHTSTVGPLATGRRAAEGVLPSPYCLFQYLVGLGRNDGIRISEAKAVRKYLTPLELELRDGAVWYLDRRFCSNDFANSAALERVGRGQQVMLRGYVLELCLARIWVEWDGKCLCLNYVGAYRDAESEAYATAEDVTRQHDAAAVARSVHRESATAAAVEGGARRRDAGIDEASIKVTKGRLKKPTSGANAGARGLNAHGKGKAA